MELTSETWQLKEEFDTYLVEYEMDGAMWGLHIKARSFDDAHDRINALRHSGKVLGILKGEIRADIPGAGIWIRLLCWWKNLRRSA